LNPAGVQAPGAVPDVIFYDGHCGLCHRLVRFTLAADRSGEAFRFAPLGGAAFCQAVPESRRAHLPDSVVLLTAAGALLTRSAAVVHILRRLGGAWWLLGLLVAAIPTGLRDLAYDAVAASRFHLFRRPDTVCPLMPAHLRTRFIQ
jgi:predicted DCC family thiol-disulfide oxidoreductase YuxK